MNSRRYQSFLVLGPILTAVLLLAGRSWLGEPLRAALVFGLLWFWPTLTWAGWLAGRLAERLLLSASLVLLVSSLTTLLLSYLPGPFPSGLAGLLALMLAAGPGIAQWFRRAPDRLADTRQIIGGGLYWLPAVAGPLLILLLALALRLPNLAYKELQGDEGLIMVRAAAIITGDEQQLFLHQKGPVEILLPLVGWGLAGASDDFWPRLPFTWAGWLAVLAVYLLARRWFGRPSGIAAGLLFGIMGFGIAFSRIVQYQSLVMLWGTAALLLADRYRCDGQRSDLWLSAALLAGGLLAHYDAVLVVPAAACLVLARHWPLDQSLAVRSAVRRLLPAVTLGGAVLALFYVPFALNPNFGRTISYVVGDRVGAGQGGALIRWSGPAVWQMVTFYNSLWYILGLASLSLLGLGAIIWGHRHAQSRSVRLAAGLFFLVPLLFYTLVVVDPRTHVYTFFPGAVILAGVGAASLNRRLRPLRLRPVALTLALVWLVISTLYVYLMFVDTNPERQRTWSVNRPWPVLYPVTWTEPPLYGLFGFPHQAGWRILPDLLGPEAFPYASNEEAEITRWYLAQAPHTYCDDLSTFILVENAQDEIPFDPAGLDDLFVQAAVAVNGRPSMTVYGRRPVGEVVTAEAAGRSLWRTPEQVAPARYEGRHAVGLVLTDAAGEGQVRLLGYDLDSAAAVAGGRLVVTLYWQALVPFERNFQSFVHLYDGRMLAQHDSAPECGFNSTTGWEPGQIIRDPHVIELPEGTPGGRAPVLVGMYDLLTLDRLLLSGQASDFVRLAEVEVRPGP